MFGKVIGTIVFGAFILIGGDKLCRKIAQWERDEDEREFQRKIARIRANGGKGTVYHRGVKVKVTTNNVKYN